jgi:hypothetical protein
VKKEIKMAENSGFLQIALRLQLLYSFYSGNVAVVN